MRLVIPPSDNLSDPVFVNRLRNGDAQAFETFVRASAGRMLTLAKRMLRDEADAQDALQEAYIQAHKALPQFEARSSPITWLHAITVRACLMRLRSRRAHEETSIEPLLPQFAANGHRQDAGPAWSAGESASATAEERAIVRDCINKLPDDYRNILLLRDIEELDTRQVATHLGISESLVKTRLHRARQALRTLLEPHFKKADK